MRQLVVGCLLAVVFVGLLAYHRLVLLQDLGADRVELMGASVANESVLRQTEPDWDISWETDRMVIHSANPFTAQRVLAALKTEVPNAIALDYSWSTAVLRQSGILWTGVAAIIAVVFFCRLAWRWGKRELVRCRDAQEEWYLLDYLSDAGVRLLAEAIVLVAGLFLTAALLRWLWNVPVALPAYFLPDGSIFDIAHYEQWASRAFPKGVISEYGAGLMRKLQINYGFAGMECIVLVAGSAVWGLQKDKRGICSE